MCGLYRSEVMQQFDEHSDGDGNNRYRIVGLYNDSH